MTDPILSVAQLSKRFQHAAGPVQAVDEVAFQLSHGEFVAVMGASGSGKSTLLHLIAGFTTADSGRIAITGRDLIAMGETERTRFRRDRIGLIFQAFNLIPDLTGRENILLPSRLGGTAPAAGEPDALIDALGIGAVCRRHPDAMSGGEQQRVAIARALVARPALLLADEPTGALDTANSQRLCGLLRTQSAACGTTVLMVTHNPVVAFWADRILVMRDGRLVEDLRRDRFADLGAFSQHYADLLAGKAVA
jgi:putative ABC transport system ATP-binding protein